MTEKLYYTDSYMSEFSARVISCEQTKNGFLISLDKTAFFPEGGGQLPDTGYIGTARISDVQEWEGEIYHLSYTALESGAEYACSIDWQQRLGRMQSHSGEHIVSGLAHSLYGCENVGFHMGEDAMTIDLSLELSWEQLMEVESRANEAVRANVPVRAWLPSEEELKSLEYRSKLELTENVRIVEFEGYDVCACCAPHVSFSGQIGSIKILDSMRHRGGVRVTLVCGRQAEEDYRARQESVTAVSRLLSAKRGEIAPAVERLMTENRHYREKSDRLSLRLVHLMAGSCRPEEGNICVFDDVLDEIAQRELVNLLMDKSSGLAAVFCGSDAEGWRYIIGSKSIDLRKNTKAINSAIEGRGGGSVQMIQGRAAGKKETIEKNIKELSL